jgi:hypothetical protein
VARFVHFCAVGDFKMSTATVIVLIIAIAVIVVAAILLFQREKTRKRKTKFGPEYDRVVSTEGSPRRAEAVLDSRQKRVEKYEIRRLGPEERDRFAAQFRTWSAAVDFEAAAGVRGWVVERIQSTATFCRIVVRRSDRELLIDVAVDAPPLRPASVTIVGPTFDREELAGRKILALFDRAEARDFVDVYLLARHFSTELLLTRAFEIDAGFDRAIFAEMLGSLSRFSDADIPLAGDDVDELRAFFATWRAELTE